MAFDDTVESYLRLYNREQIEEALSVALGNHASGVTVTTVSYEGRNTTGQINGSTDVLIAILNTCLKLLDLGWPDVPPPSSTDHWDFHRVRLGT